MRRQTYIDRYEVTKEKMIEVFNILNKTFYNGKLNLHLQIIYTDLLIDGLYYLGLYGGHAEHIVLNFKHLEVDQVEEIYSHELAHLIIRQYYNRKTSPHNKAFDKIFLDTREKVLCILEQVK